LLLTLAMVCRTLALWYCPSELEYRYLLPLKVENKTLITRIRKYSNEKKFQTFNDLCIDVYFAFGTKLSKGFWWKLLVSDLHSPKCCNFKSLALFRFRALW
jgi:hypothetical protein